MAWSSPSLFARSAAILLRVIRRPLPPAGRLLRLLVYDFNLLVDYLAGEPVDRNMNPVALLSLHDEICEAVLPRRVVAALRYYIDQQVPSSSLIGFGKRTDDRLALRLRDARIE